MTHRQIHQNGHRRAAILRTVANAKGVYHITCVDGSSQWKIEAGVEGISEAYLLPVLQAVMDQFAFEIEG